VVPLGSPVTSCYLCPIPPFHKHFGETPSCRHARLRRVPTAVTIRRYFKADLQLSLGEGFIRLMLYPSLPDEQLPSKK
jgi:hypothetical protein